jgi:hypothetical protein
MNENILNHLAAALGAKVSKYTGTGMRPDYWSAQLMLPDGVRLFLQHGGYSFNNRISVSGSWPSYTDAKGSTHIVTPRDVYENGQRLADPSITVAATRPVPVIANEISRRLLTTLGLRAIWHKVKAHADATTADYMTQREFVERAAVLTGGEVRAEFKTVDYGFEIGEAKHGGGYADTPHHFDVTLRNVSLEELVALLTVVKTGRKLADG